MLVAMLAAMAMAATVGGGMQETQAQKDARMEWWREARFGMFIHWGLYAIPAGQWGSQTHHGEWIMTTAQIPVEEYEKFVPQFNPVDFDADEWVRMAKDAGMKYIVITTKHHDGFALFDSKTSDYDVMATPFKRDIMKELAEACRRQGMKLGWYHSIMDWHHPDYLPRRDWEKRPAAGASMDRYVEYLRSQVTELLTNYGDVAVMWFDGEWESTWNHGYGKPLYELCRKLQPNTIVNNRVSNNRAGSMEAVGGADEVGDFGTPEQHIPATGLPGVDWETCMTMNNNWGWNKSDKNWKASTVLIRNLIDIASKGGNYLLNIGPMANGQFPPESVQRLKEIGEWMRVNGDAIYGTTASPFDPLSWGRVTVKRGADASTLYLHVFEWPSDGRLVVPGLGNEVKAARVLGGRAVSFDRSGPNVLLSLPGSAVGKHSTTVVLEIDGAPVVFKAPKIVAPATIVVGTLPVLLQFEEGLEVRYTVDGSTPTAASSRYSGPIQVRAGQILQAATFHSGKMVSDVVQQRFEAAKLQPSVVLKQARPGIVEHLYRGNWDLLPDFDKLGPDLSSAVSGIEVPRKGNAFEEYVGLRYAGFLNVPENGVYVFDLTSDDGSRLRIGDWTLDNDGLHSTATKTGAVALAKGYHPLRIEWFNKTGGAALDVKWARAGDDPKPLTGFFH